MSQDDSEVIKESDEHHSSEENENGAQQTNISDSKPDLQAINSDVITPRNDNNSKKGSKNSIIENLPVVQIKLDDAYDRSDNQFSTLRSSDDKKQSQKTKNKLPKRRNSSPVGKILEIENFQ